MTVGAAVNVLTYGDYDRDGWPDLSAASTSNSTIYTLLGGSGGLAWKTTTTTGASPRGIVAVDVDQDGRLDLVTGNRSASTVSVHLGGALGTFGAAGTFAAGAGSRAVAAGDFDHDGRVDIAAADQFGNAVTVLSNSTIFVAPAFRFTLQRFAPEPRGGGADMIATADFDRNGRLDVASATSNHLSVFLAGRATVSVDSTHFSNGLAVADFNRDGAPDLVTADFFSHVARVYLNRGDGSFLPSPPISPHLPVQSVATADVNRDGIEDVALGFT